MKPFRIQRGLMSEEHELFNDHTVNEFKQNIQNLYAKVEIWLNGMVFRKENIDIYEEYAVPYKIAELYIYKDDHFLCKLKPVGAHIIAADGRVDLIGKKDKLSLIFFKELLQFNTQSKNFNEIDNTGVNRNTLYEGYEGTDWYVSWGKRKISLLTETIFFKAMEKVCGYKHH